MKLFALLVPLVGCGSIFDLDKVDRSTPDATVAPDAAMFSAPSLLYELSSPAADDDVSVTADGLDMYFASARFDTAGNVLRTSRASLAEGWGEVSSILAGVNTPRIHAEGLVLFYADTDGNYEIFQATRATRQDPWLPGASVSAFNGSSFDAEAMMTSDGLSVYFTSTRSTGNYDLWYATRASRDDAWSTPALVPGVNTTNLEQSPCTLDGLTLYFSSDRPGSLGGTNLWVATRPALGVPFDAPVPVDVVNSDFEEEDPWISADGTSLWFASDRDGSSDLYVATR